MSFETKVDNEIPTTRQLTRKTKTILNNTFSQTESETQNLSAIIAEIVDCIDLELI